MCRSKTQEQKKPKRNNEEIHEVSSQPALYGTSDSEQYLSGVHRTIQYSSETPDSLRRKPATRYSRGCSTGLSGMHRTVWVTIQFNGQLLQTSTVG
jgi:hypothetical protein